MSFGIEFLKAYVTRRIASYRFRKYQRHVESPLRSDELGLVLPFAYFLADDRVKVVYDIGAADGRFASAAAKFKNVCQVIAFEPLPDAYTQLQRRVYGSKKISTHNVAVGEQSGEVRFFITQDGDASSCLRPNNLQSASFPDRKLLRESVVRIGTLDEIQSSLGLPGPDLVKIDTQGYELRVLRGASKCLHTASLCIVECSYVALYEGGPLIDEIQQKFFSAGWRIVGVGPQLTGVGGKPLQVDLVFSRG